MGSPEAPALSFMDTEKTTHSLTEHNLHVYMLIRKGCIGLLFVLVWALFVYFS